MIHGDVSRFGPVPWPQKGLHQPGVTGYPALLNRRPKPVVVPVAYRYAVLGTWLLTWAMAMVALVVIFA